jgi:hypothetical protein
MPDSNNNQAVSRSIIYRPKRSPVPVTETDVTATVQDGPLVVTGNETFYWTGGSGSAFIPTQTNDGGIVSIAASAVVSHLFWRLQSRRIQPRLNVRGCISLPNLLEKFERIRSVRRGQPLRALPRGIPKGGPEAMWSVETTPGLHGAAPIRQRKGGSAIGRSHHR